MTYVASHTVSVTQGYSLDDRKVLEDITFQILHAMR